MKRTRSTESSRWRTPPRAFRTAARRTRSQCIANFAPPATATRRGCSSAWPDTARRFPRPATATRRGCSSAWPDTARRFLLSVVGIAVLYLAMQTSILGVLPWREAQNSQYIVSAFVERLYGTRAAAFATVMILWIAFASLFTTLLSYSRVPFAAAEDGNFFPVFARVHPTKHFPHVSLLFLGVASLAFSVLFRLASVIKAIIAVRILVQFISQGVGVMILRRRWPPERLPFKMWLYPWPAVLSILGWAALFYYTGWKFALGGIGVIALGIITYMIQARYRGLWPFAAAGEAP